MLSVANRIGDKRKAGSHSGVGDPAHFLTRDGGESGNSTVKSTCVEGI